LLDWVLSLLLQLGGGVDVPHSTSIGITNGNTTTALISYRAILSILPNSFDWKKNTIAIVGATGSVGGGITQLIIQRHPQKLLLIGRTPKNLAKLQKSIQKEKNLNDIIKTTTNISSIKEADIVLVATNAPSAILTEKHFKDGALIYDLTQPPNVDPTLLTKKSAVTLISGGLISAPHFKTTVNFHLPPRTIFACLAETILLAAEKRYDRFFTGPIEKKHIEQMKPLIEKYRIQPYIKYLT